MDSAVNLVDEHAGGGYDSSFEASCSTSKRNEIDNLSKKPSVGSTKKATATVFNEEYSREEGRKQRFHLLALDAYSRHKKIINDYVLYFKGATKLLQRDKSKDKTDFDVIRENHRFLWSEQDSDSTWEQRLAKKYYDKLFKEYCIANLSKYKEGKIALRWRIEKEVIDGKGQFICGEQKCTETENLCSWEVNFGYVEHGEKKNALVKIRLCSDCSYKLNYRHKKKHVKQKKRSRASSVELESKKRKTSETNEEPGQDVNVLPSKETTNIADEAEIWKGPAQVVEEKSRNEEFEDYLEDLFL